MFSLWARPASRRCLAVHARSASSLMDIASLEKRTAGFLKFAGLVTKDPTWDLVPLLRPTIDTYDPTIRNARRHNKISSDEWLSWAPTLYSHSFENALELLRKNSIKSSTPSWIVLALASQKIRSASDAEALLYDLTIPMTSSPPSLPPMNPYHCPSLFVLTAHSLAHFRLISLLRPLSTHFLNLPHSPGVNQPFYFNMFLQAVSTFPRSKEASDVAISVLEVMGRRNIRLWGDTSRVLLRDEFVVPQLASRLRQPGFEPKDKGAGRRKKVQLQAWLRAHAKLRNVKDSQSYLNAIREYCLEQGITPPYPSGGPPVLPDSDESQVQGSVRKDNTEYLRSLRDHQDAAQRYFHFLLQMQLSKSQSPSTLSSSPSPKHPKAEVDIYDWTTVLDACARDESYSARQLLDLFNSASQSESYKPNRATYTSLVSGLLRKNEPEQALGVWRQFTADIARAKEETDEKGMAELYIDRYALCIGIRVLMGNKLPLDALHLLDQAVKADIRKKSAMPTRSISEGTTPSVPDSPSTRKAFSYINAVPIEVLLKSLLHLGRPDTVFYVWAHLTSLYFVSPTDKMLRYLLNAALRAAGLDRGSVLGTMKWSLADVNIFNKNDEPIAPTSIPATPVFQEDLQTGIERVDSLLQSPPLDGLRREHLSNDLHVLLESSPDVMGIWAGHRATDVARSVFRGMILGNWPTLANLTLKSGDDAPKDWPELSALVTAQRPMQAKQSLLDPIGPPLPSVFPTENTFFVYIKLLGLSSRAHEVPEALVWMRALGITPSRSTLMMSLAFWSEIGTQVPKWSEGLSGAIDWLRKSEGTMPLAPGEVPRTGLALRAWLVDWVGEKKVPMEDEVVMALQEAAKVGWHKRRKTVFKIQ